MKCHYTYDKDGKRVLIPGCMAVAISNDISMCTCQDPCTEEDFEKERYRKTVMKLQQEIKELESENAYLGKIIEELKKKK